MNQQILEGGNFRGFTTDADAGAAFPLHGLLTLIADKSRVFYERAEKTKSLYLTFQDSLFLNKGKEGALQPALAKVFGFVIRVRLILWLKKQ